MSEETNHEKFIAKLHKEGYKFTWMQSVGWQIGSFSWFQEFGSWIFMKVFAGEK